MSVFSKILDEAGKSQQSKKLSNLQKQLNKQDYFSQVMSLQTREQAANDLAKIEADTTKDLAETVSTAKDIFSNSTPMEYQRMHERLVRTAIRLKREKHVQLNEFGLPSLN